MSWISQTSFAPSARPAIAEGRFTNRLVSHFLFVHGVAFAGSLLGILLAPIYWTGHCELQLLIAMWVVTGNLGISVGYHRLFTHRSFEAVTWVRSALVIFGSMAGQGPVIYWVAVHRAHHKHSDDEGDPHSPNTSRASIGKRLFTFLHGHMIWILDHDVPSPKRYAKDLLGDPVVRRLSHLYPVWVFLGLLLPGIVGVAITLSWQGFLAGFIWGGCIRLALVNQLIWCVNSIGHFLGRRDFDTADNSRNSSILAALTFGEGWHNTHHAFPHAAKFAHKWWQIDIGYLTILLLRACGLAWNIKPLH